jgi:heme A synthase
MPLPSPGYRRLALATVLSTVLLIVIGGIVRVSDSGLGCGPGGAGLNGWPLCRGDVVPGTDINAIIEYSHRTAASIVGLLWLALSIGAFRRYRHLVRLTGFGFGLVVAQGLLGALVVEKDLDELLVSAHLGIAMLSLALAMWLWRRVSVASAEPLAVSRGFKALAFGSQFFLLGAIVAGGYMAGSEKAGLGEWARTRDKFGAGHYEGAHYACGHQFPTCNDGFLPFGDSFVNIHLTHRVFVYLTTIALISLVVLCFRRGVAVRSAWMILGALLLQIVLGGLNVWLTEEYQALIVAHLTVATLLWMALTALTIQLVRIPAPVTSAAPRRREPEAVAA